MLVQNRLFAVWILILVLALSPLTMSEMESFGIDNPSFDTSGRDDDDYCEDTYEDDQQGCSNDSLCEWDDDECEEKDDEDDEDEDYCEQYENNPSGCANDPRCESEYDDGEN